MALHLDPPPAAHRLLSTPLPTPQDTAPHTPTSRFSAGAAQLISIRTCSISAYDELPHSAGSRCSSAAREGKRLRARGMVGSSSAMKRCTNSHISAFASSATRWSVRGVRSESHALPSLRAYRAQSPSRRTWLSTLEYSLLSASVGHCAPGLRSWCPSGSWLSSHLL